MYYSKKKKITRRPVDREVQYGVLAFVCLPVEPTALYLLAKSRGILHGVCHSGSSADRSKWVTILLAYVK